MSTLRVCLIATFASRELRWKNTDSISRNMHIKGVLLHLFFRLKICIFCHITMTYFPTLGFWLNQLYRKWFRICCNCHFCTMEQRYLSYSVLLALSYICRGYTDFIVWRIYVSCLTAGWAMSDWLMWWRISNWSLFDYFGFFNFICTAFGYWNVKMG